MSLVLEKLAAFFAGPIGRWLVVAALVCAALFAGAVHERDVQYRKDLDDFAKQRAAEQIAQARAVGEVKAKQQEVITQTVIEYRDRIKVVKEKGDEIVKQVPVYVPMGSPLLGGGVRVLHDAAASGDVPDDPVRAVAAADPVETSTLLSTVAGNYATCRADQERLSALQKLVSTLQKGSP